MLSFAASTGIVTGEATIGQSADGEMSITGELVENAAALQEGAGPGDIVSDMASKQQAGLHGAAKKTRPSTLSHSLPTREVFVIDPAQVTQELDS